MYWNVLKYCNFLYKNNSVRLCIVLISFLIALKILIFQTFHCVLCNYLEWRVGLLQLCSVTPSGCDPISETCVSLNNCYGLLCMKRIYWPMYWLTHWNVHLKFTSLHFATIVRNSEVFLMNVHFFPRPNSFLSLTLDNDYRFFLCVFFVTRTEW